jgi:hypothetical protein
MGMSSMPTVNENSPEDVIPSIKKVSLRQLSFVIFHEIEGESNIIF